MSATAALVVVAVLMTLSVSVSPALGKRATRFKGVSSSITIRDSSVKLKGTLQYRRGGHWKSLGRKYVRLYKGNGYGGWTYSRRVKTNSKGAFSFRLSSSNTYRTSFASTSRYHAARRSLSASRPWSSFRAYANHSARSGFVGPTAAHLRWSYKTGGDIHSSPAIAPGGTIYFGSADGKFRALRRDGSLKWAYPVGAAILSSPAIAKDGTVYFGTANSSLVALNPSGSLKWRFQATGDIHSSPAIGSDGAVYVGCEDTYLYAINPNGSLRWKFKAADWISDSSPAIGADGTVYVGSSDMNLYAVGSDGVAKWVFPTQGQILSSPAVGSDGTIYVGSGTYDDVSRAIYAVKPEGTLHWRYPIAGAGISSRHRPGWNHLRRQRVLRGRPGSRAHGLAPQRHAEVVALGGRWHLVQPRY